MKVIKKEIPQVQGWYFVKQNYVTYWQLLVYLTGKAPFLKITRSNALINDNALSLLNGDLTELDWSEPVELDWSEPVELDDVDTNTYDAEYIEMMRVGSSTYSGKLAAIKLYKERTGIGLKEAKEYIDNLQDKYLSNKIN